MFFSKSLVAAVALCLSVSLQVHAHAAIAPALGVQGTPVRNNAQRPSNARPCGNTNIAQTIDSSTAVTAAANGQFQATITNFNAGVDGSTQVTAKVDATGTGQSFVNAQVVKNGERAPSSTGSVQLTVQLPAGTTCSGGASGSKCLVSFVTAGGFGNCVVVDQAGGAAAGNGAAAGTNGAAAGTGNTGAAAGTGNTGAVAGTGAAAGTGTTGTGNGRGRGRGGRNRGGANAVQGGAAAGSNANAGNAANANANANGAANATALDRLRNFIEKQRQQQAAGTRRARIARRAAERPAVEVLA